MTTKLVRRIPAFSVAAVTLALAVPPAPIPTLEQVRNATVIGIYDHPVTLHDGVYEGPPFVEGGAARPRLIVVGDLIAFGNLDTAAGDEAVALLAQNSAGSGEMLYLAWIGLRDGAPVTFDTFLVGDRIKIRSFAIAEKQIVLDVVESAPGEAKCCPTQLARKTYGVRQGAFALKASAVTGTLSLATLAGPEWTVVAIDGEPLAASAGKPPTLTIEGERIAGFGGCNRFAGSIRESAPGEVALGALASTKMACPDPGGPLERRCLASLGKVTKYSFVAGKLLLTGTDGAVTRSLLLARGR